MNDNQNSEERRCLKCKKLLIDEKIPFCLRCKIEGVENGIKIGSGTGAVYGIGKAIKKIKK